MKSMFLALACVVAVLFTGCKDPHHKSRHSGSSYPVVTRPLPPPPPKAAPQRKPVPVAKPAPKRKPVTVATPAPKPVVKPTHPQKSHAKEPVKKPQPPKNKKK